MKAIRIHDYGDSGVLSVDEIDRPEAGPGQVLIRNRALGVNPVDWKLRSGYAKERFPLTMPCILGGDIAGVVEELGEGVTGFAVGERVYSLLGIIGAYAEYTAVDARWIAHSPRLVDDVQAASIPLAALTAWQGLFEHANLVSGQSVLIHGAAGGVGGFAVQFARAKGARVIATASARNADYVLGLGAQEVFDYRTDGAAGQPTGVDLALDLVGDEVDHLLAALKPGAVLLQIAPAGNPGTAEKASAAGVDMLPVMVHPDGAQLAEIAALIDSGEVVTHVDAVFALEEVAQAHDLNQEGHTRGKIVLSC